MNLLKGEQMNLEEKLIKKSEEAFLLQLKRSINQLLFID